MSAWLQELRGAFRSLRGRPGLVVAVTLTLGLGVGATTAIFSAIKASLLFQFPATPERERIASLFMSNLQSGTERGSFSFLDYADCAAQATSFESLAAFRSQTFLLGGGDEPVKVSGLSVTGEYFRVLGVQPKLGRVFSPADDQPGAAAPVVLSHGLWQRQFGSDPGIVGRAIQLDGKPVAVIGVLLAAPVFRASQSELWLPLARGQASNRGQRPLMVLRRRKAGRSWEQARQELDRIARQLAEAHPGTNAGWGIHVVPLDEDMARRTAQSLLFLLLPALFILLISCGNAMNLLLARAAERRTEMAVRAALGARRLRIVRQLLAEGLWLAALGGAAGLAISVGAMRLLRVSLGATAPGGALEGIRLDPQVVVFAVVVVLLTPLLFALVPAMQTSKVNLVEALNPGSSGSGASTRKRTRGTVVAAQVAMVVLLLIPTGVLLKFYAAIEGWEFNREVSRLLVLRIERAAADSARAPAAEYWRQILDRMRTVAGVQSAAATTWVPDIRDSLPRAMFQIRRGDAQSAQVAAFDAAVSPEYFAVVGLAIHAGRSFTPQDDGSAPQACIVNAAFAQSAWPGENPLGRQLRAMGHAADAGWATVVGVAGDFDREPMRAGPPPRVYFALAQRADAEPSLLLRAAESAPVIAAMKQAVWDVDRARPAVQVQSMRSLAAQQTEGGYAMAGLLGSFGLLGLLLAGLGVYSVVSYSAATRTREMRIRMALGARPAQILGLVIRDGLPCLAGLAIGVAGAWGVLQVAAHEIGRLNIDLQTTGFALAAAAVTLGVGLVASCGPARRAARVDPMVALRHE